jgi:hypothetical protein
MPTLNDIITYMEAVKPYAPFSYGDLPKELRADRRHHDRARELRYIVPATKSPDNLRTVTWQINGHKMEYIADGLCPEMPSCHTFTGYRGKCKCWDPETKNCSTWNGRKRNLQNARKVQANG